MSTIIIYIKHCLHY